MASTKDQQKDPSLRLSAERSDLAIQRTILANIRTYSAWIRTGLSIVLAGLAIVGFIGEFDAFSKTVVFLGMLIGFLFVFLGIFIYIMAYIIYRKSLARLKLSESEMTVPLSFLFTITAGMVLTALLIALLLIFL